MRNVRGASAFEKKKQRRMAADGNLPWNCRLIAAIRQKM